MSTFTTSNTAPPRQRPPRPPRPPRSSPGQPRDPGWSPAQRTMFLRACTIAGITGGQRYIVMRHCGCPLEGKAKRPSVKHPRNTNTMFEQCMAVAEAHAAMRRASVPPPREFRSWKDAANASRNRLVTKARAVIAEAIERMPKRFDTGLEAHIVAHTTADDDGGLMAVNPTTLDEADGGQCHRALEALRAWVGREFHAAGITPRTFTIPPEARRRAANKPGTTPAD